MPLIGTIPNYLVCFLYGLQPAFFPVSYTHLDVYKRQLLDQVLHNEGLEQLQSHLFGQTALVHLQLRADDDNRTAGIVHAFAQQVLAEAALLALEPVSYTHLDVYKRQAMVNVTNGADVDMRFVTLKFRFRHCYCPPLF